LAREKIVRRESFLAVPVAALLTAASAHPAPCDGVYLAADGLTDYPYDGFSESDRRPTWQVTAHCWRADGFYAGTVVTGVDFAETPPTTLETDFYAGKHVAIAGSRLNLELLYTAFPNKRTPGPSYNFVEPQAEFTHVFGRLTLKGQVGWSPDGSGGAGEYWHVKTTAAFAVTPWLSLSGHAGQIWEAHGQDRLHWDVGASGAWRRLSLDVRYGGTNLDRAQCYGTSWCEPGPYATLTWRLLP
jgi:uncharacterized protein (TIGR02001 family)